MTQEENGCTKLNTRPQKKLRNIKLDSLQNIPPKYKERILMKILLILQKLQQLDVN